MSLRNLPDDVTILRPSGADAYGNPDSSWASPEEIEVKGFLATRELLLLPPGTDVLIGDRVRVNGVTYSQSRPPERVRSLRQEKLVTVALERLEV